MLVAAVVPEYLPAMHEVHVGEANSEYFPAMQSVHVEMLVAAIVPE
jgi:hypothetical protein